MVKPGKKGARRRSIIGLLRRRQEVSLEELARRFEVSVMTIRRDVARMVEDGVVTRTFGGCMLRAPLVPEAPATEKRQRQRREKMAVAQAAVTQIKAHARVYLDTGTTVEAVARLLPGDLEIQVLTGNLAAAMVLFEGFVGEVIVHGGRLGRHSPDLTGDLALAQIRAFRLDLAIVGADGVDPESGEIYAADLASALVSRAAQERAERVVLVADSSKFSQRGAAVVDRLRAGMTVITDDGLAKGVVTQLRQHGCEVILVDRSTANEANGREAR